MRADWRLLAGAALATALAGAAVAQDRTSPESLLPPGFGQPAPAPAPTAARDNDGAAQRPAPSATRAAPTDSGATVQPVPAAGGLPPLPPLPGASPTAAASAAPVAPAYQLPDFARRSLGRVGPAQGSAFASDAFGHTSGLFLETLMRRLSAPLPSRWMSLTLRRLLTAPVDTPARVNGADFAAERAWLLLRMGESVSARAVVQSVDTDNLTPKLRQIWMQAALANADPAGLCAVTGATPPAALTGERGWVVARAMCAALVGAPNAQALLREGRRRNGGEPIDLQLAQKVMGAGVNSRQAITIEWNSVSQLTTWRFGLATATGVEVPESLYATVGPQVTGWRALSPAIPLAARFAVADRAAAMGVLSNSAMVDLYAALADDDSTAGVPATQTALLRDAYVGTRESRVAALRRLWSDDDRQARYGRLVLTARAAARLGIVEADQDADRIVAAMLAAGLDRTAQRWRGHVPEGSDAWAMLTLADPDAAGGNGAAMLSRYAPGGAAADRKRQLFLAGLAGLGRLSAASIEQAAADLDVRVGTVDAWTRAIDAAAREGQAGTVVLLCAAGMQTGDWAGVPAAGLYRMVAALRAVGLDGEARMLAAEAIARA